MINLLISAAGTGAAWNLIKTAKELFPNSIRVIACDINPKHLIPASKLADTYYQVTKIADSKHGDEIRSILKKENIHYFLPVIDKEIYLFPCDDPYLQANNINSLTLTSESATILKDKQVLNSYLHNNNLLVPKVYTKKEQLTEDGPFFMKPKDGFGSLGARQITKEEALTAINDSKCIVQELCQNPEITIDVFNYANQVNTLCRERIETKSGVCTKAKVWHDHSLHELAEKICEILPMPPAFCFQVMYNNSNSPCITDINPRLGAGSSMGGVCGWNIAAALLSTLSGETNPTKYLHTLAKPIYVTRVYQDICMGA